jgi:hypothetical protein
MSPIFIQGVFSSREPLLFFLALSPSASHLLSCALCLAAESAQQKADRQRFNNAVSAHAMFVLVKSKHIYISAAPFILEPINWKSPHHHEPA